MLLENSSRIESIAIDQNGRLAICRNRTSAPVITYWPTLSASPIDDSGVQSQVYDLAFSPLSSDNQLITGGEDRQLRLWDLNDMSVLRSAPYGQRISAVAWHPDGQSIAYARQFDNTIEIWNQALDEQLAMFTIADQINVLTYSPDGRYLVAGAISERTQSGAIYIWETNNLSAPPIILAGHTGGINDIAFFEQQMASASDDGSVRLWQLETFSSNATQLLGHTQSVTAVSFTPDGRLISSDGVTIRLWFTIDEYIANGCQQVRRNLADSELKNYLGGTAEYQVTCDNLEHSFAP